VHGVPATTPVMTQALLATLMVPHSDEYAHAMQAQVAEHVPTADPAAQAPPPALGSQENTPEVKHVQLLS
jgi:hypothetical protein